MATDIKREYDFKWVGRDKSGKRVEGMHRAVSQSVIKTLLIEQGIQPIRITKSKAKRGRGGKVTNEDVMNFSRQMKTMMSAGIPISEALGMQAAGMEKLSMRELLLGLRADVDRGEGLSGALNKRPTIFSPMFRGLVAAGEESGTLETVFEQLATFLEKSESTKKAIKKAMIYPIAVIVIALGITAVILVKVVPVFEEMFASSGKALPGPTQMVINISDFVQSTGFLAFLFIAGLSIFGFKQLVRTNEALRYKVHKLILRLPVIGGLSSLNNSSIFSRTLATMYDSGTPMISALGTVAGATTNELYKEATLKMRENVSIGQELNFAMRQSGLFPELVVHMVGIGEKSGNLSDMLYRVAETYEEDIDNAIDGMMSLIEPILIVVLGVLVGGIVVAMYLPLFSMGDMV